MAQNSGILCHITKLPGCSAAPLTRVGSHSSTSLQIDLPASPLQSTIMELPQLPYAKLHHVIMPGQSPSMVCLSPTEQSSACLVQTPACFLFSPEMSFSGEHTYSPHFLSSKILHNILFFNLCHYLELRRNSNSSLKPPSISKQETTSHSSRPPLYYIHYLQSLSLFLFFFSATFSMTFQLLFWITAPKN